MEDIKSIKLQILTFVLVVFHTVGLYFMCQADSFDFFSSLSGWNLVLTFILFLLSFDKITNKLIYFFILCFTVGMTFEWIGVHTGYVFGTYRYGNNLGIKLFGVPLTIGINWIILTISSANISHYFIKNLFLSAFFGASLMVLLDYLIEHIAPTLGFWYWQNNVIPIYNYVTWFVIGFILQVIYFKYKLFLHNIFTVVLFLVLTIFFSILNITL